MLLTPRQQTVWREADARWNALVGATSSGKTYLSYYLIARRMRELPAGNSLLIGKTERTYCRNVLDPMRELWGGQLVGQPTGKGTVSLFGRRCYLVGANDERSITKIQGLSLVYANGDEFPTWPETFFQMLKSRIRQPGACADLTANPEGPYHWAKRFIDETQNLRSWHFTLDDNPFLDPQYVEDIRSEYSGMWYQRYILGLWVAAEGAIYDMFDESVHVIEDPPPDVRIVQYYIGLDYGTTNPTVFLLLGVGSDACMYVLDEYRWDSVKRGVQKTDKQYSDALGDWVRVHLAQNMAQLKWVYFPPDANSFRIQVFQDHTDLRGKIAVAPNEVLDGIRRTGSLLTAGRLKIARRCSGLIEEVLGYCWDPKAQKVGDDAPLKTADHGCFVSGTQVKTSRGDVAIEQINVGDMVLTRLGYRPVTACGLSSASASVLTVRLSDGRLLTGTANHPVFVQGKGFLRLDSLRYGDKIESWETNQSFSRASRSGVTPTRRIGRIATTLRREKPTSSEESGGFMKRFGKLRMGLFRMVSRFTTETSIRLTMICRTWNVYRESNTLLLIGSGAESAAENGPTRRRGGSISSASRRPQSRGIARTKAENGTASTVAGSGMAANLLRRFAISVGQRTKRDLVSRVIDFVLMPASLHGEDSKGSITKYVNASYADQGSRSAATAQPSAVPVHVLGICAGNTEEAVYNLTVAGCHEYYANGVLVHNCDALRYLVNGTRRVWVPWMTRGG